MSETNVNTELKPEQVEQFLIENPTFFLKREHLLAELFLPYGAGAAVSLQERQVGLLRERNIDMRKRLNEFLEQGERNDVLYKKTTALILNLLEAKSLAELIKRLHSYCESEFQIDKAQFSLFTNAEPTKCDCRVVSVIEVERVMPTLLRSKQCMSGVFRDDEWAFLFGNDVGEVASAIVLPIKDQGKTIAMLTLGSNDPLYFKAGMNTLFLGFIGDVISKLLPRFV
jgi:uncharacterized protein